MTWAVWGKETESLAIALEDFLSTSFGLKGFVSGPPLKGKLGYRSQTRQNGGICLRMNRSGEVVVQLRIALGYKVNVASVCSNLAQTSDYVIRMKGCSLTEIQILVDRVSR